MKKIFRWFFPDVIKTANDRGLYSICGIFLLFFAILFSVFIKQQITTHNEVSDFSYACSLNKGIAVRDLNNKMRCVPTFSAAKDQA